MAGNVDDDSQSAKNAPDPKNWLLQGVCKDEIGFDHDVNMSPYPGEKKIPWRYVTSFIETSWQHGFCATANRQCVDTPNLPACVAETLTLPGFEKGMTGSSLPYDVTNFRPYAPRVRWFRTFNDAYLTTNWQDLTRDINSLDNAINAFSTSAIHPTAEGNANVADSLFRAIGADICARGELDDSSNSIVKMKSCSGSGVQ